MDQNICVSQLRCGECITELGCAWCPSSVVDRGPRCNLEKNLTGGKDTKQSTGLVECKEELYKGSKLSKDKSEFLPYNGQVFNIWKPNPTLDFSDYETDITITAGRKYNLHLCKMPGSM